MGGCASKPKDNDGTSPEDIPVVPDVTPAAVSVTEAPEIQAPGGSNDDAKEENKKEAEAAVSEAKAEGSEIATEESEGIKADEKSPEAAAEAEAVAA
ncbi:hypothetical protein MUK42_34158 [Musa troglodytarum]|uniref:Uncharacterized protein n=1 Tax=Musa troglodytarum TaxID=320322 RepID=A0A9E7FQ31_9LILI|nr:hypothetical protein MUK42_34158 [Musa troglodytarum]